VSNYLLNLAEGRNPENPGWVSTEPTTNVPSVLKDLYPLVQKILGGKEGTDSFKHYQVLNTLLAIPRMSDSLPELDLTSVIEPLKSSNIASFKEFSIKFKDFLYGKCKLTVPSPLPQMFVKPSFRMTSGPNGGPTLSKAAEEAKALMDNKILSSAMRDLATITGNQNLILYLEKLQGLNLDTSSIYLSKLILVPDSLNKHRLVAIVDYWTNLILDPIEDIVKGILIQNFPSDYMINHARGAESVRRKTDRPS